MGERGETGLAFVHTHTHTDTYLHCQKEEILYSGTSASILRALTSVMKKFPSLLHSKGQAVDLFGRLSELIFIKVLTRD